MSLDMKYRHGVLKSLIVLALPMFFQSVFGNLMTLFDNVMIGSLGAEAVTGVAICSEIYLLLKMSIMGVFVGLSVFSVQFYGGGNIEGVRMTARLKFLTGLFMLLVSILLCLLFKNWLFEIYLRGTSVDVDVEQVKRCANEYLMYLLYSYPCFFILQLYVTTLRETGNSIKAMVAGVTSVLVNVVLNYIFIYGNFGCLKLGVRGAGLATFVACMIELVVLVGWTYKDRVKHIFLKGLWSTLKVPYKQVKVMIKGMLPLFFNEILWALGVMLRTQCYATRGVDVITGLSLSNSLCNVFEYSLIVSGGSLGILVGHLLGRGDRAGAKRNTLILLQYVSIGSVLLTGVVLGVMPLFLSMYDVPALIEEYACGFVVIRSVLFIGLGIAHSLYCGVRAGGNPLLLCVIDSGVTWLVTLPVLWCLATFSAVSTYTLYILGYLFEYFVKIGLFGAVFQSKKWGSRISA